MASAVRAAISGPNYQARLQHRAGSFYLYRNLPPEVVSRIGAQITVVKMMERDGYTEIWAWSPHFEPIKPGDIVPHYRWMYDTDTFEISCAREELAANASIGTQPSEEPHDGQVRQAKEDAAAHAHEEGQAPVLTQDSPRPPAVAVPPPVEVPPAAGAGDGDASAGSPEGQRRSTGAPPIAEQADSAASDALSQTETAQGS